MFRRLFRHYIADEVRPMLQMAVPLVMAELGWTTMATVDTIMVGRQANSAVAIAAVGLAGNLYYAVAIFGAGLMLGLDTLVSHSYGAGDLEDAHRSLVNGNYLSVGIAPLLMGLIFSWERVLRALHIQQSVLEQTIPYLRAINWSTLPLLFFFVFRRYLQGINLARPITFSIISANLVNFSGNWALIYGHLGFPAMGTVGSGWATCISRVYMAAVLAIYCIYYDLRYKTGFLRASRLPHLPRVRQLVRLGFPAAMQLGLEVAVFATATAIIAKLGAVALASHQIALIVATFTYMVPLGISSAAAVRVGHALGRRDPRGASRAGWTALALGAGFMSCTAAAFWLAPHRIVHIYTRDPVVIGAASRLLFVAAFFQLFDGLQTVATGALRGAGDTRTPMICSSGFYWLVGLPLGAYLCFQLGWGAVGLWTGLCIALILIGSTLLYVWSRRERSFDARAALRPVVGLSDDQGR